LRTFYLKIVDVKDWAPTPDGIDFVTNTCKGKKFSNKYTMLKSETVKGKGENDVAIEKLLNDEADAMWVYADQVKNY
jgi:hypothetical protein